MRLHHDVMGRGPDLLLLHGWGLHGGVWSTVLPELAESYRVHVVDLPGHGRSPGGPWGLPALVSHLLESMPAGSIWLGWSLGGLVALAAASSHPGRIARLILVAATPRFVGAPGWPFAVEPELLAEFAASLHRDCRATLARFLGLQVGDGAAERAVLRRLRAELVRYGEPDRAALHSGLEVLRDTDLRASLARIDVPATLIYGGRDRLVPPKAATRLAQMLPRATRHALPRAGHAPFLSEPEAFVRLCRGHVS